MKYRILVTEEPDPAAGESTVLLPATERLSMTVDRLDLARLTALLLAPAPVPRRRRSDAGRARAAGARPLTATEVSNGIFERGSE